MPRFTSPVDGAQLFYRDYKPLAANFGKGEGDTTKPALVFLHGWPYSSLMWEDFIVPLCEHQGFRCIASDRRGFGKSDWEGPQANTEVTYKTFAQDTAYLLEHVLKLGPFVVVANSMGPGESVLASEESEHFRQNCKGFIWVACALPGVLPGEDNFSTGPQAVWDAILGGLATSRTEYTHSALPGVLVGETGRLLSPQVLARYERIVEDADGLAIQRCARTIRSVDFTEKLRRIGDDCSIPILCVHGDMDIGAPYESSAKVVKEIVPRAEVKIYEKGAHGLHVTHTEQLMEDILGFVKRLR